MEKTTLPRRLYAGRLAILLATALLWYGASQELYAVAWGTGAWWGEFSPAWAAIYVAFLFVGAGVCAGLAAALFRPRPLRWAESWFAWRIRLGVWRWVGLTVVAAVPVLLLQYTPWGIVFGGPWIRLLLWAAAAVVAGILLTQARGRVLTFPAGLAGLLLTGAAITFAFPFMNVSSHPFSLGWSEGNRLWDYSILFGRERYDYPPNQPISVLLDIGRQLIGGVPFLIPGVSIAAARFWLGLTVTIPYIFLGLSAFHRAGLRGGLLAIAALWTMLFLRQGPIHPPLVVCAILVALLWRAPLAVAIPLLALTGYAAAVSRFTWLFAPALWIGMLEFGGAIVENGRVTRAGWVRSLSLGAAGALGGYFGPRMGGLLSGGGGAASLTPSALEGYISAQPLLWYRLLPNATYGAGILVGLLIAVAPLAVLLMYLRLSRRWVLHPLQRLALLIPLAAFLVVGLIVSTKIGGGGDLHNMDMFLIGLLFASALALADGRSKRLNDPMQVPAWARGVLVLLVVIPVVRPLQGLRTIQPVEDLNWLRRLTDSAPTRTFDLVPRAERVSQVLAIIQAEVVLAVQSGDVLFLDQRQLLTFSEIRGFPLVPEYEKKVLMNDALKGDPRLFEEFYSDLASQRFALIVSEPLRAPVKDSSYQFGEENNAWAKWVVGPVLCYYEAKSTLKDVQIELLVPTAVPGDCSSVMP